jgi:hypothetical protein
MAGEDPKIVPNLSKRQKGELDRWEKCAWEADNRRLKGLIFVFYSKTSIIHTFNNK